MKKLTVFLACLVLVGITYAQAQTVRITGTVTGSEDGMPIPGVSVVVKGTTSGAATNVDGKYELNVASNAEFLIFSAVGFKTQEVAIGGRSLIDIVLVSESVQFEELVVTALGITREKKSLGYSVQEVKGDALNVTKGNDFASALTGKVAGLQIKNNTNFGGSTNIIVRGSSSLTGNNQALFVVDGVPIDNSILNNSSQKRGGHGFDFGNTASDFNPNDIESVTVLKGAAATALYGSRAANGVILITTKKGSKSKGFGVEYSGNFTLGVLDKSTFPKYQKEYGGGYSPIDYGSDPHPGLEQYDWNGDGIIDDNIPTYEDASMGEKFDPNALVYHWNSYIPGLETYNKALPWVAAEHDPSYFFNTAKTFSNSIQVSGSGEKATYRFSYQNLTQSGLMPNSELKKNNFGFTSTYDLTSKIKLTSYANYIATKTKGRNATGYNGNILSSFRQWYQVNVDILDQKDAYDQLGTNATWNMNAPDDLSPAYWDNPYWDRYKNYESDERNRFIGYTKVDWILNDIVTLTSRVAVDNYSYMQEERRAVGSIAEAFGVGLGDASSGYALKKGNFNEVNFDLMASFKKDFNENLNLTGLLGCNIRQSTSSSVYSSTTGGLAVPDLYALANTQSPPMLSEETDETKQVNGFFGNASVNLYKIIFLEGSLRVDQSSTLPKNNNTYLYPSASASFLFTKFLNLDFISLGKLRLNYAEVGSDAPFSSLKDVYFQAFPFSGNGVAFGGSTKMNPDLKPERTKSIEAGLTLNFLNNRIGLDIAMYDNRSIDQIMPVRISAATGYLSKFVNAGEVSNKGIELMLNLTPVVSKDFKWDVDLNWAKNKSEVISLAEGVDNLQIASLQGGVTINARVGEPYGTIQGTDFVYYNDEKSINKRIIEDGIYQKTATSDKVIGDINPDWTAGLRNSLSYKNFNLSFLIDWKKGGDIFSLDMWYGTSTGLYEESVGLNELGNPIRNYAADGGGLILPGVLPDGTPNNVRSDEMGTYYTPIGSYSAPNAMHIYDASYIKLRELSLSYTFDQKLFKGTFINGATLSFVGSNLWIIHKNLPYSDPETTQGAGNIQGWQSGVMPSTRNFGFTLNLKF